MDFELSDDQEMLRDSVRRYLADRCPIRPYVRDRLGEARGTTAAVWEGLVALGVTGLLVGSEHGGTASRDGGTDGTGGTGMVDAAVVLEELGRALHPGPYASTAIGAAHLVGAAGDDDDRVAWLPGLASGATVGTVALLEPGSRYSWRAPSTRAISDDDGRRLHGTKVHVADACDADLVLVVASGDEGLGVYAVDASAPGVTVDDSPTVDGTRKEGTLALDGAPARRLRGADPERAVATTVDRLAVASVVDGLGAAARALELAVDYAKERVQFGKPIGSFQAVAHLCADMLRTVELARAVGYYACWAADGGGPDEAHRAATMAKAYAGETFATLGDAAIQVFGGIGFTWEHDVHLFYKRLLSASTTLGGADDHLAKLADLVLGRPSAP